MARLTPEQVDEIIAENTRLRAALAYSELPCAYCTLPKEELARCASGFPGCGRADDMLGCPNFVAAHDAECVQQRARDLVRLMRQLRPGIYQAMPRINFSAELDALSNELGWTLEDDR